MSKPSVYFSPKDFGFNAQTGSVLKLKPLGLIPTFETPSLLFDNYLKGVVDTNGDYTFSNIKEGYYSASFLCGELQRHFIIYVPSASGTFNVGNLIVSYSLDGRLTGSGGSTGLAESASYATYAANAENAVNANKMEYYDAKIIWTGYELGVDPNTGQPGFTTQGAGQVLSFGPEGDIQVNSVFAFPFYWGEVGFHVMGINESTPGGVMGPVTIGATLPYTASHAESASYAANGGGGPVGTASYAYVLAGPVGVGDTSKVTPVADTVEVVAGTVPSFIFGHNASTVNLCQLPLSASVITTSVVKANLKGTASFSETSSRMVGNNLPNYYAYVDANGLCVGQDGEPNWFTTDGAITTITSAETRLNSPNITLSNKNLVEMTASKATTASYAVSASYALNGGGVASTSYGFINLPVQSAKYNVTSSARVDASDNNWRLLFDATAPQSASWQFLTPDDYGSTPIIRVCYTMNATQTGTNAVVFRFNQYSPSTSNDVNSLTVVSTILTSSLANNQTAGYPVYCSASIAALTGSAYTWLNVERMAAATADTATGDIEVIGLNIKYTKA